MEALHSVLVVAHLVGMAAVVGGYLTCLRAPRFPSALVWGARAQIVTGILLVGLLESGALDDEPNRPKVAVKLAVAIVLTGVAEATKRRDPLPTWAFHLVGGLALVNVLVAVLW
ncbi:hypothetical protein GCM10028777_07800 [Angustibacter speluncae]